MMKSDSFRSLTGQEPVRSDNRASLEEFLRLAEKQKKQLTEKPVRRQQGIAQEPEEYRDARHKERQENYLPCLCLWFSCLKKGRSPVNAGCVLNQSMKL